ncbi:Type II/IV secretion system protein TadC, associated with Flp pilus assembly [hydrothermal vent metagenome]|uniref:Type II/IV secretion system protein TadC, associated with Flp pilus assembly n=1 Tax=hydrothermal vent metagenome TaxID=652676 RepID=A0A1W1CLX5_9ZZZZ
MYYLSLLILFFSFLLIFWAIYSYIEEDYEHKNLVKRIFDIDDTSIVRKIDSKKRAEFKLKLIRGGLTQKEFNEIIVVSVATGVSLISLIFILELSDINNIALAVVGVGIAVFMPFIYLDEQMKARIKRIDNDLAIFIDLLIIILEGGGGLNNAIDRVTLDGTKVLGKDLLEESNRFKNELITYDSDIAYNNLVERTGSEAIGTIVGFMRLSEETGIGVKTIFENQSKDIKDQEMLNVEKKAATMNISITFTMFVFILPAVIAMIAFPMAADALMPGF